VRRMQRRLRTRCQRSHWTIHARGRIGIPAHGADEHVCQFVGKVVCLLGQRLGLRPGQPGIAAPNGNAIQYLPDAVDPPFAIGDRCGEGCHLMPLLSRGRARKASRNAKVRNDARNVAGNPQPRHQHSPYTMSGNPR